MISIETHQAKARANQFESSYLNHCWCSSSWPSQMMWTSDWREHMWTKLMPRYAKAKAWFQGRWSQNSLLASVPTCTHHWCPLVTIWIRNGSYCFLVICTGMSPEPLEWESAVSRSSGAFNTVGLLFVSHISCEVFDSCFFCFWPLVCTLQGHGHTSFGTALKRRLSIQEKNLDSNLGNSRIALSKHPDSREKYRKIPFGSWSRYALENRWLWHRVRKILQMGESLRIHLTSATA